MDTIRTTHNLPPSVSIVVLSHNRPQLLRQALASMVAQAHADWEILLVDNPSPQTAEVAHVAHEFPRVRMLQLPQNLGYAGGMNAGAAAARGEFLFLTEDDIVLDPRCLEQLLASLRTQPEPGLVAPLMYNHSSRTIRAAGGTVRLNPVFALTVHAENAPDHGQFCDPFEVGFVPGAALLCRRDVFIAAGGFDPRFFMYLEDVDLCLRLQARGRRLLLVPAAKVYHFDPPPAPASARLSFHKLKNLFVVYLTHARWKVLPAFFLRYGVGWLLRKTWSSPKEAAVHLGALVWIMAQTPYWLRKRRDLEAGRCQRAT